MEVAGMRVGVMGAGSVGCYVGGRLAAAGVDVLLVGRERLLEEAKDGLTLVDLDGREHRAQAALTTEAAELGACDLVLCCVKSGHTAGVAEVLNEVLEPRTAVVSLQNGVRNVPTLRSGAPGRTVVGGVVAFNVVGQGGGRYRQTTKGGVLLESAPEGRALAASLSTAGMETRLYADLAPHQWTKLLVNLNNAVVALTDVSTQELLLNPDLRRSVAALVGEGARVLKAAGIPLAPLRGIPPAWMPRLLRLPTPFVRLLARQQLRADPAARSSMWEDFAKGRRTEVEFLNGEIVRVAAEHRLEAPCNAAVVDLVRAAEEAGQGSPRMAPAALWRALSA